jgi:hypothetical protein
MAVEQVVAAEPAVATPVAPPGQRLAHWYLLGLVVLSLCIRPVVEQLNLPGSLINVDSVLTALGAGVLTLVILLTWRRQPATSRMVAVATSALGVSAVVSWALGSPRTWAGFALAFACVLLFPVALVIATQAVGERSGTASSLAVLRFAVLLQLVFGFAQYLWRDVAKIAPYGADFINGTTSHNLWPVFALPASLVLALVERHRFRMLWPASVVLLAIYGEGKAALMVWLPGLVILLLADMAVRFAPGLRARRLLARPSVESALVGGVVVMFIALVVGGLWWNSSVQGTWAVFRGHTTALEHFVKSPDQPTAGLSTNESIPTLKTAARTLAHDVPESPRTLLFGLGPANTVSHAGEILVIKGGHGLHLPAAGPVATKLMQNEGGRLKFEDAQSSMLGIWGDLGTVGALLYLAAVTLGTLVLIGRFRRRAGWVLLAVAVAYFTVGTLVGGVPLDWPEQTGVVLPLVLAMVVAARALRQEA